MPVDVRRRLIIHFVMGGTLGALLAAVLYATDVPLFRLLARGTAPALHMTVVAGCFIVYCAIGATLSGFLLLVTEQR